MSVHLSLRIHYKSQPAVTRRQCHQKRIMGGNGCKKNPKEQKKIPLCFKVIFSSQGKTCQAHLGAKRNSPIAAGEYKVEQALPHLPAH